MVHALSRLAGGCLEWMCLKGRQTVLARSPRRGVAAGIVLALLAGSGWAHDFGDDVGDAPSAAQGLAVDGAPVARVIEIDQDEDWYTFAAKPFVDYTITVSNATLFDAGLSRYARDGAVARAATHTLPEADVAALGWTALGALNRVYIRVSGLFEFTTGTYHVAVSSSMLDADLDGLPDDWEMLHFTNMTWSANDDPDGDGMRNEAEWWLLTDPDDPLSTFQVTAMASTSNATEVTWQSSTGGLYIVQSSSNLLEGAGWRSVDTNTDANAEARHYLDAAVPAGQQRFYRVIYDY
jgi:hypothetical protein